MSSSYRVVPGFRFVAFYDSRDYGGGVLTRLHKGVGGQVYNAAVCFKLFMVLCQYFDVLLLPLFSVICGCFKGLSTKIALPSLTAFWGLQDHVLLVCSTRVEIQISG
jgi:hypothetical protein